MRRYLCLGLLLGSLALAAKEGDVTGIRWQGRWHDGNRDALLLSPLGAGQMKVHYWRKLDVGWQQSELQFDAVAEVRGTDP